MNRRVVSFNYVLKGANGEIIDSSDAGEPIAFLEGAMQIIPALEKQIVDLLIGTKKNVKLAAADAYGLHEAKMVMDVPKAELAHLTIEVGSFLQLNLENQTKVVRVAKMTDEFVTLDGNHPLAGQDLEFDVEIVDSRTATPEEVSHGHAHGLGGHHH